MCTWPEVTRPPELSCPWGWKLTMCPILKQVASYSFLPTSRDYSVDLTVIGPCSLFPQGCDQQLTHAAQFPLLPSTILLLDSPDWTLNEREGIMSSLYSTNLQIIARKPCLAWLSHRTCHFLRPLLSLIPHIRLPTTTLASFSNGSLF